MAPLTVEIWSDVVCPWCYVGKRRFEKALAGFEHRDDVEVTWRSFELDPGAPQTRETGSAEHLASKYGTSLEEAQGRNQEMERLAKDEGLEYHLDRTRGGNSFDAHRLVHLAAEHGRQDEMQERLMRAYFTEGEAIGDPETLVRIAVEMEIDPRGLLGDAFADAVREDEELARRIGIRGVPFFVLNRRYGISGAQPAELLRQALEKAWQDGPRTAAA